MSKADKQQNMPQAYVRSSQIKAVIGSLYYSQFNILLWLTIVYYSVVLARDISSPPVQYAAHIYASDVLNIVLGFSIYFMEKVGYFNKSNIFLTPIPVALAMINNAAWHMAAWQDPQLLIKSIMIIFAFGVVSMLPWIFWLLATVSGLFHLIASYLLLGDNSGEMMVMGLGTLMISYGGFAVRYNSVRKQTRLSIENAERALEMERLSRTKDQFISNMSHELRTPLTGLVGMVDLIDATQLSSAEREHLAMAKASAGTLKVIINDVLDMSQLAEGRLVLELEPFDAREVVEEVIALMEVVAAEKGIQIQFHCFDEEQPLVEGDVGRIRQVLLNLVGNAIKFTEVGSIKIDLSIQDLTTETATLRWQVEDTGIGISEKELPRLFERFEQVDASSTRGRQGTGLGLAISSDLVRLMGGEIKAESRQNKGSKFWFDLPFSRYQSSKTEAIQKEKSGDFGWVYGRRLRILVAEDNPVNQVLLTKILAQPTWEVCLEKDGARACEAGEEKQFDIILMDVQMPKLDGVEVTKRLRSGDGPNKKTPIFAVTANCHAEDVKEYLSVGMNGYIVKPIDRNALMSAIASAVKTMQKGE